MSFELSWSTLHPGRAPIGWMLRTGGCPNWIRFHSLPGSKRYADTPTERAILLARQNELALSVLSGQPCWLVQARWPLDPTAPSLVPERDPFRATHDWNLQPSFEFVVEEDELGAWRAWASPVAWKAGEFDDLLMSIADDRAAPTLWLAEDGAVFAPYDGGVDLFPSTDVARSQLAARYADWLSRHPEGL